MDFGLGLRLGTGRNRRIGESVRSEERRYLRGIHPDLVEVDWTVPRVDDLGLSRYVC